MTWAKMWKKTYLEEEDAFAHSNNCGGDGNVFNILSKSVIYIRSINVHSAVKCLPGRISVSDVVPTAIKIHPAP